MKVSGSGLLSFTSISSIHSPPPHSKPSSFIPSSSLSSPSSSSSTSTTTDSSPEFNPNTESKNNETVTIKKRVKFTYSRASPSIRYPNLKLSQLYPETKNQTHFTVSSPVEESHDFSDETEGSEDTHKPDYEVDDAKEHETLGSRVSKKRVQKMNRLALKKDKYWRDRVKYLTDRILGLKFEEFVADVLDERKVQMTPTDFCFLVKWVGQTNWQRGLEVYEWLNLRQWFSPNARMLATIIVVLGKANQEALAVEIFTRGESSIGDTVQVYNEMMGVYARSGRFDKVKEMLDVMRERGCEPDLVSFNTLINARMKSGAMVPNLAMQLLNEVRRSRVRPDIITYNTLISACSRESNLEEAIAIFDDMVNNNCQPDLWTYNAMISVYGRCGHSNKAEELFRELESKGFFPDAVTYNSLLNAFSKEGNTEKVRDICEEMVKMGFGRDEMTYNTIMHMYEKQGRHDQALQLYRDMKSSGRNPDAVTYTVLINSLGKANKVVEAASVMSEMLDAASQVFYDMRFSGIEPSEGLYQGLVFVYCRMGFPETAHHLLYLVEKKGSILDNVSIYIEIIETYGKLKIWQKAESLVGDLRQRYSKKDRKVWNALIHAYAFSGCYERAREFLTP
ncbi:hypothetical protein RIF29_28523 [Crotalaria pallida]|uniref:Pentatricopeptide repeat-containing protein n=1 Tax=Crotalaria pallida TaxID=3830 RepID=A0AAN9EI37_CROPI